jgi:type 1 fimbriae regulatory protein FimB/type 1 fimbriae regulatory protein FimE
VGLSAILNQPPQLPFSAKSVSRSPPPVKVARQRDRECLRSSEVEAMLRAAHSFGRHGVRDAAIILLMFRHGLRTAELVALKWSQVDLSGGYIEIILSGFTGS